MSVAFGSEKSVLVVQIQPEMLASKPGLGCKGVQDHFLEVSVFVLILALSGGLSQERYLT